MTVGGLRVSEKNVMEPRSTRSTGDGDTSRKKTPTPSVCTSDCSEKLILARGEAQNLVASLFYTTFALSNKNHTTMTKKNLIKIIVSVLIAALTALGAALGLNSCNVVRTITNKSEFYQRGDTSVMIQTKTTESYDATKKL